MMVPSSATTKIAYSRTSAINRSNLSSTSWRDSEASLVRVIAQPSARVEKRARLQQASERRMSRLFKRRPTLSRRSGKKDDHPLLQVLTRAALGAHSSNPSAQIHATYRTFRKRILCIRRPRVLKRAFLGAIRQFARPVLASHKH